MKYKTLILLVALAALTTYAAYRLWRQPNDVVKPPVAVAKPAPVARTTETIETAHYTVLSSATPEQSARVVAAVESLHDAYLGFFGDSIRIDPDPPKLKLMLYKHRSEFKTHNRSSPWAEAFYLAPYCHAYYAEEANPYHWMLHEATHQLNSEVAGFARHKWINEGLATYFGASMLQDGQLKPGTIDADAYPIWWLARLSFSGDLEQDIADGTIIPLRDVIAGTGPDINQHVNLYYIEYWSLSHFLFHYRNGLYSKSFKRLISEGGTLQDFERIFGPVETIEAQWYEYLMEQSTRALPTQR